MLDGGATDADEEDEEEEVEEALHSPRSELFCELPDIGQVELLCLLCRVRGRRRAKVLRARSRIRTRVVSGKNLYGVGCRRSSGSLCFLRRAESPRPRRRRGAKSVPRALQK